MKKAGIFLAVIILSFIINLSFISANCGTVVDTKLCPNACGNTLNWCDYHLDQYTCSITPGAHWLINAYTKYSSHYCGQQLCGNGCCTPHWGSWGACSKTCGSGTQSRSDGCGHTQSQACNTQPCCTATTWYYDPDSDGYSSIINSTRPVQCNSPGVGWRNTGFLGAGDCNDANAAIHPTAAESCNNIDDNCNGQIDENVFDYSSCNQIGACFGSRETCHAGAWGACSYLPQPEILDTIDNNCNGLVDEGFNPPTITIVSPVLGQTYNSSSLLLEVLTNEASNCRYNLDGVGYVAITALNTTHFSDLINLPSEGSHSINVNCTDTNGQSTLASVDFVIDTIPPAINIISPSSLQYTLTRDIPVQLTSDGTQQAIWYNWNGTDQIYSSIDTVTFNEGWNTITAYVNDSIGNMNSRAFTFLVDSVSPVLTITNPATNGESFGVNNIPIEYTLVDSNAVFCWWTNDSGMTTHSITCGDNITGQIWNEGVNTVQIYAEDSGGRIGTDTRTFSVDNSAPLINIINPVAGGIYGGTVLLSASITDANLDLNSPKYEIRENGVGGNLISSGALTDVGGIYGGNLLTNDSWANMNLTLIVHASDTFGESSSASVDFVLDNSVPSIIFITPSSDNSSIFNNNFSLNILVQGHSIASTDYSISDSLGNLISSRSVNPNLDSYSFDDLVDVSALNDGTYSVLVGATDSSTPADSASASASFVLDRTNPSIISIFPVNNGIYNYSCINVDVTFDSGIAWFIWNGVTYTLPQPICTPFNEGNNTIEVYVNDSAGNINNENVTFSVDTINPNVWFDFATPADLSYLPHSDFIINVSASESGSGIQTITINTFDSLGNPVGAQSAISGLPLVNNFEAMMNLPDGTYSFTGSACDKAGNCNYTETRTVTIDTLAPILTVISPANATYHSAELNFEVSGDETLNSCWYSLDGNSNISMDRIDLMTFNASSGILAETPHSVVFGCLDIAGNIGTTDSNLINFGIDYVPPTLIINSPLNQTYPTRDILLNITSDGDTVWYNWNGIDSPYVLGNILFNRWSNTLTAYANDSSGNINTQSRTFFVDLPVTIMYSDVYNTYYPHNVSEDVTNINFIDSYVENSSIEGTLPVDVALSYIIRSNLTDLTLIYNCTAIDSIINGGSCQISIVIMSNVSDTNLTDVYSENSTITNSTVFNSTVINADITNSNVDNSNIINSTIDDSIIQNASIIDGVLLCGNITFDGNLTVSDCVNPINLTDIIDSAPVARLVITPSEAEIDANVILDGSDSTDSNIPGALNDSLTYSFDLGNGTIYTESNSDAPDGAYDGKYSDSYHSIGLYNVILTVSDAFGKSSLDSKTINIITSTPVTPPAPGPSGGGGSPASLAPGYQAGPGNKIYWPTGEELARGYNVSMRLREVIKFFIEYKLYYFETTSLTADHLGAEVRWPIKLQDFNIGDDVNIDVNDDGHEDVNIRLNGITYDGKDYFADVTIKRLFKEGQTAESDVPAGTVFEAQTTNPFVQFLKNNWIVITAIVLALAALGIGLYYYLARRKSQIGINPKLRR